MLESEGQLQPGQGNGNESASSSSGHQVPHPLHPAGGPTPRPIFMPETFTGVGRGWSDWAEQFDLAADVNNWDETLKLKFMSLLLSGRARDIYSGLSAEAKNDFTLLKAAMARCLEPYDSEDWTRASFASRRRLHNESPREFGNSLRRLVIRAYPSADSHTQDLLARDQFITHFATGDFRINLRSAKPPTLEAAINLASEMELLRTLEQSQVIPDAKVRGVLEKSKSDERIEGLLVVVEGLRQEVKSLQTAIHTLQAAPKMTLANPPPTTAPGPSQGGRERNGSCWECGCNRHIRRDCPYLQGN